MDNRLMDLEEDIEEAEEDEEELTPEKVSQTVVYGTDWTVETILAQLRQKNIDMPPFQRRDAWPRRRKSRYIESIMLGLPVPQIILAERKEKRGSFLVLDGKQRLLSLLQFIGEAEKSSNNKFRLQGLEVLRGAKYSRTYEALREDPEMAATLIQFNNQPIRAMIIRNWPSTSFLHMLFVRLNSESLPLSPQELRQALWPGRFVEYIDEASQESPGITKLLGLKEPDSRMRDVEMLVRYMAFAFFLEEHPGSLKGFLDLTCDRLNKDWEGKEDEIRRQVERFEYAVNVGLAVFDEDGGFGRRWTLDGGYSARLIKSVLDVQLFYFSDEKIGAAALEKKDAVIGAFKKLCEESDDFLGAIGGTTKSIRATSTRLNSWGNALKDALGLEFSVPSLTESNLIAFPGFW